MKTKKFILSMGMAVASMLATVPANAAEYIYTMSNGSKLTINSTTSSATFIGADINTSMTSTSFATFTGGANPVFTAVLSALDGVRKIGGTWYNDNEYGATTIHPQKLIMSGNSVNLWAWWGPQFQGGDYVTSITGYTFNSSTTGGTVPEPGMLGLFGIGAAALLLRRRRKAVAA